MINQPFITIITPTYNAEKFIEKCIKSVQSQTFSNYEHLIIDGLSTDKTVQLVTEIQKQSPNIRLIVEKDKGVFDAMNKGIQAAQSQWIYFLGSDDFLNDDSVLDDIVKYIQDSSAQIIYGDVYFENVKKLYDREFDIEKILKKNICHQSIFYHESVFKNIGLYNIYYPLVADYEFNLRCWLNGRIKHEYFPRTIAHYAHGGISSIQHDTAFEKDYPFFVVNQILTGDSNRIDKIYYLSIAFRKIFQRYSFKTFVSEFFKKQYFLIKLIAFFWMCLSLPFYFFKKFAKR